MDGAGARDSMTSLTIEKLLIPGLSMPGVKVEEPKIKQLKYQQRFCHWPMRGCMYFDYKQEISSGTVERTGKTVFF
jgi:hypothetical protein